jgi:hypothetical protein
VVSHWIPLFLCKRFFYKFCRSVVVALPIRCLYTAPIGSQCQGCQMVYFQTENPNLSKFSRALDWKLLIYFLPIWSIVWTLEIFCTFFVDLVHIFRFWYRIPRKIWQPCSVSINVTSNHPSNHERTAARSMYRFSDFSETKRRRIRPRRSTLSSLFLLHSTKLRPGKETLFGATHGEGW